jgi:hypothetical protein
LRTYIQGKALFLKKSFAALRLSKQRAIGVFPEGVIGTNASLHRFPADLMKTAGNTEKTLTMKEFYQRKIMCAIERKAWSAFEIGYVELHYEYVSGLTCQALAHKIYSRLPWW